MCIPDTTSDTFLPAGRKGCLRGMKQGLFNHDERSKEKCCNTKKYTTPRHRNQYPVTPLFITLDLRRNRLLYIESSTIQPLLHVWQGMGTYPCSGWNDNQGHHGSTIPL